MTGLAVLYPLLPGEQMTRIDTNVADIAAAPATAAAGSTGLAADAGHVHPQPPMFAPSGLTGAVAATRYVGGTASGAPVSGTFAAGDLVVDQTGKVWICTAAGTPGTWATAGVALDATAADIQPDGVQAAGATGKAADAGHVHPEKAWDTLLIGPSGALAETMPRRILDVSNTLVSGTAIFTSIGLPKGTVVSNLTFVVGSSPESGGTHGWYALVDSTWTVRAVSADQTGATFWGTPAAAVTLAMTAPYTVPAAGIYYVVVCVVATTMPGFCAHNGLSQANATGLPLIAAQLAGQSTPPAVGTTLTTPSASTNQLYAYAS